MVIHGTEIYLENEWSWGKDKADKKVPRLRGTAAKEIKIGWWIINGSTPEKAPQILVYNITSNPTAKDTKLCASDKLDCWYSFTLVQSDFVVCLWARHSVGLSFNFKTDITEPSTTTSTLIVKKTIPPNFWNRTIYDQKYRPTMSVTSWSLKWVELLMQIHISTIKLTYSPFLSMSYAGWLALLHG